jgi:pimeloyl-ACP methyl ester carboxylesterase
MWHGAWCWEKVTPLLHAAGHEVHTVTLTGVGERAHLHYPDIDMHTHIQDVVSVLEYEDLHNVILVGHSLAGFMTRGVAERVPERVAQIISLDGRIPESGDPFKTVWPDIWTELCQRAHANGDDEWSSPDSERTFGVTGADLKWMMSKLTPHPLKTWETPLSFTNPAARCIPRVFIHCTVGISPKDLASEQKDCVKKGWQYRKLLTGHDAMITAPKELTELLLEFI